jgi:hypothetical protein
MKGQLEMTDDMRNRLKAAVNSVPAPAYLATRVQAAIREAERPRRVWAPRLMAAAAGLVICIGVAVSYQLGHLRLTTRSQNSYIASVSNRIATIMRAGLGDHLHCTVFRKFPKNAPKVDELAEKMGPEYRQLIPVVTRAAGPDYRLIQAHECGYLKRRYVHLALKDDSNLMSVVITKKREGESFQTEALPPALVSVGVPFYQSGVQRFQIAGFETRDYLVYLVSDTSKRVNTNMLVAMAPGIRAVLQRLES